MLLKKACFRNYSNDGLEFTSTAKMLYTRLRVTFETFMSNFIRPMLIFSYTCRTVAA
jgi:hypothetical protein